MYICIYDDFFCMHVYYQFRRLEQQKERARQRKLLEEKVAAQSYARSYLSDLQDNIFTTLEREGAFYDPLKKEVGLPYLCSFVAQSALLTTLMSSFSFWYLTIIIRLRLTSYHGC